MTDWADQIVAKLDTECLDTGGYYAEWVDNKVIAQALRDVKLAETARCLAILAQIEIMDGHHKIDAWALARCIKMIKSGEAP